jgi:uncharacterized protein
MARFRGGRIAAIAAAGMLAATGAFAQVPQPAPGPQSVSQLMEFGSPAKISAAIKTGLNVESRQKDNATPLMIAAGFNQDSKVIQILLNAGAKIDERALGNVTPLMYAAFNQDPVVISRLLKAGADLNAHEYNGITPLMIAASFNQNPRVVQELLKAGAAVDARDNSGMTALMYAARNPNPAITADLVKAGASVAFRDKSGMTPLMWAALDDHNAQAVSILLKAGATGKLTSDQGKTAYDYATMNPALKGTRQLRELRSAAGSAA